MSESASKFPLRQLVSWLRWPIGVGLLIYLLWSNREGLARLGEESLDWRWLTAGFLLAFGSISLTFIRWYLLVWALEFPFRLRDAFRLSFLGYLFNYVGPGSIGGDLVKAVSIAREHRSRRLAAIGTIIIDRALGLYGLFLIGALATIGGSPLMASPVVRKVVVVLWVGTILGTLGLSLVYWRRIEESWMVRQLLRVPLAGRLFNEALNALLMYQSRPRILLWGVLLSVINHVGIITCFYCCGRALQPADAVPTYWSHMLFIPVAEMFGVIAPTPGGMGALEWAVSQLYGVAARMTPGAPPEAVAEANGLLSGLGFRCISIMVAAIGGIYYLFSRTEIDATLKAARDDDSAMATGERD